LEKKAMKQGLVVVEAVVEVDLI
jgi:hypothetical protein